MSRHIRPRVSIAALLIFALAILVPIRHAFALTVQVNGFAGAGEWPTAPQNTNIGNDPVDQVQPDRDITGIYYTNNSQTLFFRIDTADIPNRTNTNITLALDTGTGGTPAVSGFGPAGTDIALRVTGDPLVLQYYLCAPGCSLQTLPAGASFGTQPTTVVTEIGFPVSATGLTNGSAIGIAARFNGPGGNFDNAFNPAADGPFFRSTVPGPLPVTLTSFEAKRQGEGVLLTWETSGEIDVAGFHILRSSTDQRADAVRMTSTFIPSSGDGVTGASYRFTDTDSPEGTSYRYWLQVVSTSGDNSEEYGPVVVSSVLGAGTKVYLPLVRR